jgi:phage terminase Nu1 subunit (DNA packaging protein)
MGKIVTLQELADLTGYAVQTLIRWQQQDEMPVMLAGQRGRGNQYDTQVVIAWLVQRELAKAGASNPRDDLDRVKRIEVELRIAEKLDMLAPAALFEKAWCDHVEAAKTELLLLPAKIADAIYEASGAEIAEAIILPVVEAVLSKLEKFDGGEPGDSEGEADPDALGSDELDDDESDEEDGGPHA